MIRADEHGAGMRTGLKGTQVTSLRPGDKWYLSDMGRIYGPVSWLEIKGLADKAKITPFAQIREESWPQWMPIGYYLRIKTQSDLEIEGLMPSRYDGIFFVGVFVFIVGIVAFIVQPIIGIPLLIISPIIEIVAIHLENKHKGKAITRTLGNAIAIVWIVMQIVITIFIAISFF